MWKSQKLSFKNKKKVEIKLKFNLKKMKLWKTQSYPQSYPQFSTFQNPCNIRLQMSFPHVSTPLLLLYIYNKKKI